MGVRAGNGGVGYGMGISVDVWRNEVGVFGVGAKNGILGKA